MQLRRLIGWLVSVLVGVSAFVPTTNVGATACRYDAAATASTLSYDLPRVTRIDAAVAEPRQVAVVAVARSHAEFASLRESGGGIATTLAAPVVATNTAGRLTIVGEGFSASERRVAQLMVDGARTSCSAKPRALGEPQIC